MDDKDSKTLEHISATLDEVLAVIKKPRNRFLRILDIGAAGIGVLGVLNIAETIIKWITGGN
jgi:preprotein translocase subunit Sss1